jgi:hypothetical protein
LPPTAKSPQKIKPVPIQSDVTVTNTDSKVTRKVYLSCRSSLAAEQISADKSKKQIRREKPDKSDTKMIQINVI